VRKIHPFGPDRQVTVLPEAINSLKSLGKLDTEQVKELIEVFDRVDGVFSTLPGRTDLVTHDIVLTDEIPVVCKPFRYSPKEKELIIAEVERMVKLGLLRPSVSPYGSPMMIVCKEGAKPRPVAAYMDLNAKTLLQQHPIPNVEECVEKASKWKYISVFDLNRGFWQVNLTERAIRAAAILTPLGKYEPLIMNMGMKNAPFTFQLLMDIICSDIQEFTTPFQDDTAVGALDWKEHLANIEVFLKKIKTAGMTTNALKSQVAQDYVEFLGHKIGQGYRTPTEAKIAAVKDFRTPLTKRDVRSFLGLVGYYQRYVPQYSELCASLTDSLKKTEPDPIVWNETKQESFVALKNALTSQPVLRSPNYSETFIVQVDCSDRGMGVVLSQDFEGEEHPCLFISRRDRLGAGLPGLDTGYCHTRPRPGPGDFILPGSGYM